MTTIAYDKPVKDYVAELSATGHVTHKAYKKTSVTFHHNGGNLSLSSILSTWKTRAASAHFDVDAAGNLAQYVKVTEYAWAVGALGGNESSISIEMADITGASGKPEWEVSDKTLAAATRLAGWLFAHVIGARPTASNVFPHKHWSATDCPGPYVTGKWSEILTAVEKAYDSFVGTHVTTPPSTNHETNAQVADEVIAGKWGVNPERSTALTRAGYNAATIQSLVNAKLKNKTAPPAAKLTVAQVATQVIDGKWGNDPARSKALTAAGYNAAAVQHEVNTRY